MHFVIFQCPNASAIEPHSRRSITMGVWCTHGSGRNMKAVRSGWSYFSRCREVLSTPTQRSIWVSLFVFLISLSPARCFVLYSCHFINTEVFWWAAKNPNLPLVYGQTPRTRNTRRKSSLVQSAKIRLITHIDWHTKIRQHPVKRRTKTLSFVQVIRHATSDWFRLTVAVFQTRGCRKTYHMRTHRKAETGRLRRRQQPEKRRRSALAPWYCLRKKVCLLVVPS